MCMCTRVHVFVCVCCAGQVSKLLEVRTRAAPVLYVARLDMKPARHQRKRHNPTSTYPCLQ
jgi:hypothetical protein